mmetsp:Transcript_86927/g.243609  ORF Transcript_86927/g.243609 Transcript_86927/m.243609 type:complete len:330 (+) Transcript_86927:81-1070(+)
MASHKRRTRRQGGDNSDEEDAFASGRSDSGGSDASQETPPPIHPEACEPLPAQSAAAEARTAWPEFVKTNMEAQPAADTEAAPESEQPKEAQLIKATPEEEIPQVKVPRDVRYFLHDDREDPEGEDGGDAAESGEREASKGGRRGKGGGDETMSADDPGPWAHDKYFELYGDEVSSSQRSTLCKQDRARWGGGGGDAWGSRGRGTGGGWSVKQEDSWDTRAHDRWTQDSGWDAWGNTDATWRGYGAKESASDVQSRGGNWGNSWKATQADHSASTRRGDREFSDDWKGGKWGNNLDGADWGGNGAGHNADWSEETHNSHSVKRYSQMTF